MLLIFRGRLVSKGDPNYLISKLPGEGTIQIRTCEPRKTTQWLERAIDPLAISVRDNEVEFLVADLITSVEQLRNNSPPQLGVENISFRQKNLADVYNFTFQDQTDCNV